VVQFLKNRKDRSTRFPGSYSEIKQKSAVGPEKKKLMRLVPKIWGLCGTFVAAVQTVSTIGNINLNLSTTQINVPRSDRTFYLLIQIRSIMMVRVTRVNWSQSQVLLLCLKIIIRKEKESQRGTSCRFVRCRGCARAQRMSRAVLAAAAW